jgi:hypothetical protein
METPNILFAKNMRKLEYDCKYFVMFQKVAIAYYGVTLDKVAYRKMLRIARRHFNNGKSLFNYHLPVDGNDIMAVLNIEGGPEIKNIQNFLLEKAYRKPNISRLDCIKLITKHYNK